MANSTGGSFIPKRSTGRVSPVRSGKRIYILSYVAYVLFFGTLLSVVGIFFLNKQAENKLQDYVALVDEKRQTFQNENDVRVASLKKLDERIRIAQKVLDRHAAPSIIFDSLEDVVVNSVQLNDFSYERETGQAPLLSFTGLTNTFDVLLFQREIMSQSSLLASAEIVNVSYGSVAVGEDQGAAAASKASNTETSVTFTFEDSSSSNGISYVPRVFERETSNDTGSMDENTVDESDTEATNQENGETTDSDIVDTESY